jgi:hypothetical protein
MKFSRAVMYRAPKPTPPKAPKVTWRSGRLTTASTRPSGCSGAACPSPRRPIRYSLGVEGNRTACGHPTRPARWRGRGRRAAVRPPPFTSQNTPLCAATATQPPRSLGEHIGGSVRVLVSPPGSLSVMLEWWRGRSEQSDPAAPQRPGPQPPLLPVTCWAWRFAGSSFRRMIPGWCSSPGRAARGRRARGRPAR